MAGKSKRHIFNVLFGEEGGEIVKFMLGIVFIMFVIIIGSYFVAEFLPSKLETKSQEEFTTPPELDIPIAVPLPKDTQEIIKKIIMANTQTKKLFQNLEKDIKDSEKLLEEKKRALIESQKNIELLELIVEQLEVIINKKLAPKEKLTLAEWFSKRDVWFNFGGGFLIALLFYGLGVHRTRKRVKKEK